MFKYLCMQFEFVLQTDGPRQNFYEPNKNGFSFE